MRFCFFIACLLIIFVTLFAKETVDKLNLADNIQDALNDPSLVDSVSTNLPKYQSFLESVRKATSERVLQQNSEISTLTEIGLRSLGETVRNPLLLRETLKDFNNPEIMSEVVKLMNDPGFRQEMNTMLDSPKFKAAMTRASADFESLAVNPEVLTNLRDALQSN